MKDYLRNGAISRSEIVNDIKNGILDKQDIEELIKRTVVIDSFIGSNYPNKVGKDQWTEKYLEKLALAAIAESFNEDYLYYLHDVAEYVRDNTKKKKRYLGAVAIVAGLVIIAVVIALIVMTVKNDL